MSRIGEQILSNKQQSTVELSELKGKHKIDQIINNRSQVNLSDIEQQQRQKVESDVNQSCVESSLQKEQEEEFMKFIQENPQLNHFIQQQIQNVQGDGQNMKKRLMKYFYANIDYFKHIAGRCKCYGCDCGQCKCNFIHKKINDNYGTIYKNTINNSGVNLNDMEYYNHNLMDNNSRMQSMNNSVNLEHKHQQKTNESSISMLIQSTKQQSYQSPRKSDYNQSVHVNHQIQKEPQLCHLSSYQANYHPQQVQPKEIHLVREHNIVQNTKLIGNSIYKGEYHNNKGQEHFQKIEINNPLKNKMHLPMKDGQKVHKPGEKRQMVYQVDNLEVINVGQNPGQFQTINQTGYQNPNRISCKERMN